jgi:hypothetical protein
MQDLLARVDRLTDEVVGLAKRKMKSCVPKMSG